MVAVLVLLSIALITIYFRESDSGGLHQVQNAGATVLRPFEVAAERIARPFRDAYGYFDGLAGAKSENNRLRSELETARLKAAQNLAAASENAQLRRLLHFRNSTSFPNGYDFLGARIISQPSPEFAQQVIVDRGKTSGIRNDDPVLGPDGLAGTVTRVSHNVAQVTLLSDDSSAVSAIDAETRASGIVQKGPSGMSFDRVTKDRKVSRGDTLVTAGWKTPKLSSIYPPNIPIGVVTFVGQNEVDIFKHVQIEPFTDFKSLSSVLVLVPKHRSR